MVGRRAGCFGLALLVALGSSAGLDTQGQPVAGKVGLMVGQVIDAGTGRPIGGAIVSLSGGSMTSLKSGASPGTAGPAPTRRILTGSDGRFVFRDLPRGSFGIIVTKPGFIEGAHGRRRPGGSAQPVTLGEGERVGDIVVRMWKHAAISGTVLDEAGEPLVGVVIRAFRRSSVGGKRRFAAGAGSTTDDRGVYRIPNLIPGEYMIFASARQVAIPLQLAQDAQRTRGVPGLGELGVPVLEPGTPASLQVGETVYALSPGAATPPPPSATAMFVYPTTFHPTATTPAEAVTVTVGSGEDRGAIDLQLSPVRTARVSGFVSSPDGTPTGLSVRLLPASLEQIALEQDAPTTMTDRNGAFVFPAVPPGQYSLRVATRRIQGTPPQGPPPSTFWAHAPLTIGQAEITDLAITLQAGLRISGTLVFEGGGDKPAGARLQQVPVVLEPADSVQMVPSPPLAPNRVEGNGQFTTVGLPAGKYFVRIGGSPAGWMFKSAMHNGVDLSETPVDLQSDVSGVVITFTDRWTGMRGIVRSAQGEPDANAAVLIFPTDQQRWTNYSTTPRRVRSVRTSKSGEFGVTSLPSGDYYVVAIADESAADWQDPKFLESAAAGATHVTLNEGDQKTVDLRIREVR